MTKINVWETFLAYAPFKSRLRKKLNRNRELLNGTLKNWRARLKEAHLRDYPTWGKYDQKAYDILSEMINSI